MLRFIRYARFKYNRVKTSLTFRELTSAHELWIRRSQNESITTEIACIKKGKLMGKLILYRPLIDPKDILV